MDGSGFYDLSGWLTQMREESAPSRPLEISAIGANYLRRPQPKPP